MIQNNNLFIFNNSNLNNICTEKIYLISNICESVNGKISYYLTKKSTNKVDFATCINKLFINNKFNDDIICHDYVSRSLISIIEK